MKKPLMLMLILLLALSPLACKAEETEVVIDLGGRETDAPAQTQAQTQTPAVTGNAAVTVRDAVAYCFEAAQGTVLYGAVAYENTGDCPAVLTGASFTFTCGDNTVEHSFLPAFADRVVVLPGEISYAALWHRSNQGTPGQPAALAASLTCAPAPGDRLLLSVSDVFLADNYPGFTTISGAVSAPAACGLNLIYTAFYDAQGKLLGVWHFTKNAALTPGDQKAFVVHMKELPVDRLSEKAAEVRAFAVGF